MKFNELCSSFNDLPVVSREWSRGKRTFKLINVFFHCTVQGLDRLARNEGMEKDNGNY